MAIRGCATSIGIVPRCGLTLAKLRYEPSHFVPASLWLLTRTLAEKLRGWRKTKFLVCVPHVTALIQLAPA